MIDIAQYILEKSVSAEIPRRFYNAVYESYYPYDGSPEYRRIYFGNYTVFYVIDGDDMDVRRILWSGADDLDKL